MINNITINTDKPISHDYVPPRKSMFYSYIFSLLMAIIYTRTSSPIIGYINTFVILCTMLTATKQECFLLLMGLQFVDRAIVIGIGSSKMSFLLVAYAIIIIKYYIKDNGGISSAIIGFLALFILDFINTGLKYDMAFFDIVLWLLSFWYMFEFLKGEMSLDLHDVIVYFCLGVWTICIIQILDEYFALGHTLDPNMYGKWLSLSDSAKLGGFDGRQTLLRFGTAYKQISGTNGVAFDLSLGMCLCLFGLTANHKKHQFFYVFTLISFAYFGFLTISRGFYIELVILFVLFFLTSTKRADKLFIYLTISIVVGFVFLIFVLDDVSILFDAVSDRFDQGNSTRTVLIENSIKVFFGDDRTLLFGSGTQYPGFWRFTAHNHIFDSLVSLGSFGCMLYYYIIINSYNKMKRFGQPFKLFNYIPLIMLFSYRMISGRVSDIVFYYLLIICLVLTQYDYEGEGEKLCITSH